MKVITIVARYQAGGQTYIAGPTAGKTASCTSGPEGAARRLADKLYGDKVRSVTAQPSGTDLFVTRYTVRVDDKALPTPDATTATDTLKGAAQ